MRNKIKVLTCFMSVIFIFLFKGLVLVVFTSCVMVFIYTNRPYFWQSFICMLRVASKIGVNLLLVIIVCHCTLVLRNCKYILSISVAYTRNKHQLFLFRFRMAGQKVLSLTYLNKRETDEHTLILT